MNGSYEYITVWCFWDTRPWSVLKHRVIYVVVPPAYGNENFWKYFCMWNFLSFLFFFNSSTLSSINHWIWHHYYNFLTLHPVESPGVLNLCDVWASTFTPAANSSLPTCTTFQNLSLFLWGIPVIPSGLERRGTQNSHLALTHSACSTSCWI